MLLFKTLSPFMALPGCQRNPSKTQPALITPLHQVLPLAQKDHKATQGPEGLAQPAYLPGLLLCLHWSPCCCSRSPSWFLPQTLHVLCLMPQCLACERDEESEERSKTASCQHMGGREGKGEKDSERGKGVVFHMAESHLLQLLAQMSPSQRGIPGPSMGPLIMHYSMPCFFFSPHDLISYHVY